MEAKGRRRVDSSRDVKQSFVVNMGPLPVVNLATGVQPASEWTQHWDEEVGSHYYFNEVTGEATWVLQE